MNHSLHPLTIDDYDAVFALWSSCEGIGLSSADSREEIARYLERNPGMSFTARSSEQIVGAALAGHDGRRGYLHHLAVRERYRNRGIGSSLVEACLTALKREGIVKCHLFAFETNADGIAFWMRQNWIVRHDLKIISKDLCPLPAGESASAAC